MKTFVFELQMQAKKDDYSRNVSDKIIT